MRQVQHGKIKTAETMTAGLTRLQSLYCGDIRKGHLRQVNTTVVVSEYGTVLSECYRPHVDRLGGVAVERPPRLREVAGSIPGRVIPMN